VAYAGMINGLSQALLKIACPGVPDFYQGSELWSRSLVDPDNRRPVDFPSRTQALQALLNSAHFDTSGVVRDLLTKWPDGRIKLYIIWKALGCRRRHPALFREGEFIPLETAGEQSVHILAFLRRHGEEQAAIIIPKWVAKIPKSVETTELGTFWSGTNIKLPASSPNSWRNVFTAKTTETRLGDGNPCIAVSDLFQDFPFALLVPNEMSADGN
jgi:(1->4)-alpha-D-glucan 1-alpha-D-glucosylmutase